MIIHDFSPKWKWEGYPHHHLHSHSYSLLFPSLLTSFLFQNNNNNNISLFCLMMNWRRRDTLNYTAATHKVSLKMKREVLPGQILCATLLCTTPATHPSGKEENDTNAHTHTHTHLVTNLSSGHSWILRQSQFSWLFVHMPVMCRFPSKAVSKSSLGIDSINHLFPLNLFYLI